MKKTNWVTEMYLEGNNGGDYVLLEKSDKPGIVILSVGSCCVVTVQRKEIPIELLTRLLTELTFNDDSAKELMRKLWPTPHGEELANKIVPFIQEN